MKPPTPSAIFEETTCLLLWLLVDQVWAEKPRALTQEEFDWFYDHVDRRMRWLHANKAGWRRWMENEDRRIDPREQAKVWIRHWLDAYCLDPQRYQEQHS